MNKILVSYWYPNGTPLWESHLTIIIVAFIGLIATGVISLVFGEEAEFIWSIIFISSVMVVIQQFVFTFLAKKVFGEIAPIGSRYHKDHKDFNANK